MLRCVLLCSIFALPLGIAVLRASEPSEPKASGELKSWDQVVAERKRWWSFQPLTNPPVPTVAGAWPDHPIDRFIRAKLESKGLAPAPPAESHTLIRRLCFALTGLPPTPAEVDAFSQESICAPHSALYDLAERLLASPRFGEHWTRHWMDVVRYSDTHGSEHDLWNPWAWRYRDYLIRAFNADVPYDQFSREHIAGDLVPPRWNHELAINESPIGTAMHRLVEYYDTPVDPKREEIVVVENQIDTLGKVFQGLTIACARCHDHKFDPISAKDFYSLYGMFASSRATMHIVDDPGVLCARDAELRRLRGEIRRGFAAQWREELRSWPERLRSILREEKGPLAPLRRLAREADPSFPALWQELKRAHSGSTAPHGSESFPPASARLPADAILFADFSRGNLDGWRVSGPGLADAPVSPGFLSLSGDAVETVRAIQPAGFFSDTNSARHGGSLRSPDFVIEKKRISVLASGLGGAKARVVVENFQGERLLYAQAHPELKASAPEWITMTMRDNWIGLRAYLEFVTADDRPFVDVQKDPVAALAKGDGRSAFGVVCVIFHNDGAPVVAPELPTSLWSAAPVIWSDLVAHLSGMTERALAAWAEERATDEDARLLDSLRSARALTSGFPAESAGARLVADFHVQEKAIPRATRVPGLRDDGFSKDHALMPRGDHTQPGAPVARRWLEALGGAACPGGDSGRLTVAQEIARPGNPLTARVMVNRIWQWLFGRGLVATPDNFGRLGDVPSHPELLDHLAVKFIADGWSVKKLIRYIVTSRAWQMSSEPSSRAQELDPANALLSHANVRRLEAESIRDSLLAVAGNLDRTLFGAGIPVFYRTQVDTENQPPCGPLDGQGRRSLYLEIRRKFPSEFLVAFDFPKPSGSTGRRDETNVPAQSLALLNDPFVQHQAKEWALRLVSSTGAAPAQRIEQMYRAAFARSPTVEECRRALAFLEQRGLQLGTNGPAATPDPWRDLAHAIFNMKEFIYVP